MSCEVVNIMQCHANNINTYTEHPHKKALYTYSQGYADTGLFLHLSFQN